MTLTCSNCGAHNSVKNTCCVGCGARLQNAPDPENGCKPDTAFNYDEFGFCPNCRAVNLIAATKCGGCGNEGKMDPLPGSYFRSTEFWILLAICVFGFAALPVSIPSAIRIIYRIACHSSEQNVARGQIREESRQTFARLKEAQVNDARQQFATADSLLAAGSAKQAYDLFLESLTLADLGPAQHFGAAWAAFQIGLFEKALEHAERVRDYKPAELTELKVRCYLRLQVSDRKGLRFLASASSDLQPELRDEAEGVVVTDWLKAPFEDDQIEAVLSKLGSDNKAPVKYRFGLGAYRALQGCSAEALSICESIPMPLHFEQSLTLFSELLRSRGTLTDQAFDICRRLQELAPANCENALFLVKCCIARKDVGQAEAVVRAALTHHPLDQRLRYNLALVMKAAGRLQECIAELQELLRSPDEGAFRSAEDVRLLMIRCLIESALYDPAHRQLQGMVRSTQVLELLYELGLHYSELKRDEKANECWADIYSVDVRFRDVAEKIRLGAQWRDCSVPASR